MSATATDGTTAPTTLAAEGLSAAERAELEDLLTYAYPGSPATWEQDTLIFGVHQLEYAHGEPRLSPEEYGIHTMYAYGFREERVRQHVRELFGVDIQPPYQEVAEQNPPLIGYEQGVFWMIGTDFYATVCTIREATALGEDTYRIQLTTRYYDDYGDDAPYEEKHTVGVVHRQPGTTFGWRIESLEEV